MAREPIQYGQVTEGLRPSARPIDTYQRPAEPERSPLRDLANALGTFDTTLSTYLDDKKKKDDETDKLRAIADHYRNNGEGYAEGVRNGSIPAFASPSYVDAYKSAEGEAMGRQLMLQAQAEYMKWDGKDGTDPAAFDKFQNDFLASHIPAGADPKMLKGLLPVIHSGMGQLQAQFHNDLSASVYKGNIERHAVVSSQMIDQADTDGYARPDGTDYEGLWASLTATRDNALKVGAKSDDYDKQLIKTLAEKAIEKRDPNLLKLLDRTLPGQTYALSDTAGGASMKMETVDRLTVLARQAQAEAERRQAKADKDAKDTAHRTAIDTLASDPSKPLPDGLLSEGAKYDPEFKIKVLDWQKKLAEGGVSEDPKAMARLYSDIFAGGGMKSVEKALSDGTIKSAQGLKEATAYVKQMEAEGGRGARILEGNTVSTILSTIEKRSPNASPLDPFAAAGPSNAALQAQTEYKRMLLDWAARNPDASPNEVEKARSDIGRLVLSGVQGSGDEATYTRPPNEAIKAIGAEPGALPQAPQPQAPAAQPQATQPDPALEGFKNSFSPAQRFGLEERARQRGLNPDDVWKEILKQRTQPKPQVPHGSFFQPTGYAPEGSQGTPWGRDYSAVPTAPDASGKMDPEGVRALFLDAAQKQGLVGMVPSDGARYGITTGSANEWADFFTRLAYRESGHNVGTVGDVGRFAGGSQGLLQLSRADAPGYGLNGGQEFTDAQLRDPRTNAEAGVSIARSLLQKDGTIQGGLGRYWRPIQQGWTPRDTTVPATASSGGGVIPLQGLHVVDSMKPGATYGRGATARAEPFKYLVFHTSEMGGGADEGKRLVDYTQSYDAERGGTFGYHFLIDRDGTVHQIAPEGARTNHVKGPGSGERRSGMGGVPISNSNAIGISTVGATPNEKQRQAALSLGKQLMARYGITGSAVYGHGDLQSDRADNEGRDLAASLRGTPQMAAPVEPTLTPERTAGWVKRFAAQFGVRL